MYAANPSTVQLIARRGCDVYRGKSFTAACLKVFRCPERPRHGTPTLPAACSPGCGCTTSPLLRAALTGAAATTTRNRRSCSLCRRQRPTPTPTPTPTPAPQPALQITTASLQKATVGASYTATLAAAGGGNLTWTLSAGSLPSGLTLGSNGVLSGTPTGAGGYTFTVRVDGGGRSASKQLGLVVVDKLTVIAPADQTWEVRRPLQIAINAKGGTPATAEGHGTLPENTASSAPRQRLDQLPARRSGTAGTFPIVLAVRTRMVQSPR